MQVARLWSKQKALVFRIDLSLESALICSRIDFSIATGWESVAPSPCIRVETRFPYSYDLDACRLYRERLAGLVKERYLDIPPIGRIRRTSIAPTDLPIRMPILLDPHAKRLMP